MCTCIIDHSVNELNSVCLYLEVCLHLLHGGQGVVPEQGVHAHHDARGAEAALGSVTVGHPLLDRVKPRLGITDPLHSGHRESCLNICHQSYDDKHCTIGNQADTTLMFPRGLF